MIEWLIHRRVPPAKRLCAAPRLIVKIGDQRVKRITWHQAGLSNGWAVCAVSSIANSMENPDEVAQVDAIWTDGHTSGDRKHRPLVYPN